MATPFNIATAAYGNASRLATQALRPEAESAIAGVASGPNFAQMLAQSVQGVVDNGRQADQMAIDLVNGKANVVDMVTALSQTEFAIESIVTIRDRVIQSYESIMSMPI